MAGPDAGPADDRRTQTHSRRSDYRSARITLACSLGVAILILVGASVLEPTEFRVDPIVLGILVGGVFGLLGLSVSERVIRG